MSSFRLHSKYNPHKEAEQFTAAIEGAPAIIVITEPGESYLAPVLKSSFPQAKRIAVRYTDTLFTDTDKLWDAVWRPKNGSLVFFLMSAIPDERLGGTRFLSWKAADRVFPDASVSVWKDIRHTIDLLKSVMHTRSFFGNTWLKNTIFNFIHFSRCAALQFGTQDFLVAGAGPSLRQLTSEQTQVYSVVAVASAYAALAARNIKIDLCLSTDAGYWALRHFDGICADIPVAFPLEAAIPISVLEHNPCILLSYGSPLEAALFTEGGTAPLAARENGTVTGTACELLLMHTAQNIILAGVDLAASKGFSHVQPHSSILQAYTAANRIKPAAEAFAVRNFHAQSLEVYRQWFLQLPPEAAHRIFRAGTEGAPLPNIKRIDLEAAAEHTCGHTVRRYSAQGTVPLSIRPYQTVSSAERTQRAYLFLKKLRSKITEQIAKAPSFLTDERINLEKQICSLSGYTAYCNAVKNPFDTKATSALSEQVDRALGRLIKRIEQ